MPVFPSQGGSKNTWGTELRNFFAPLFDLATGARVAGQIVSADIADGTIVDADIAAGAAISQSKLVDIVDADIAAGAAISQSKLVDIVDADIAPGAAIVDTKLATIATANKVSDTALNIPNVKFMDTYADFAAAVSAIGASVTTLIISEVEAVTASNIVTPTTLHLVFQGLGQLNVSALKVVTINGPITASARQIFAGAGNVVLGDLVRDVAVEWYGAGVGVAAATNKTAIEAIWDAANPGSHIHYQSGFYDVTTLVHPLEKPLMHFGAAGNVSVFNSTTIASTGAIGWDFQPGTGNKSRFSLIQDMRITATAGNIGLKIDNLGTHLTRVVVRDGLVGIKAINMVAAKWENVTVGAIGATSICVDFAPFDGNHVINDCIFTNVSVFGDNVSTGAIGFNVTGGIWNNGNIFIAPEVSKIGIGLKSAGTKNIFIGFWAEQILVIKIDDLSATNTVFIRTIMTSAGSVLIGPTTTWEEQQYISSAAADWNALIIDSLTAGANSRVKFRNSGVDIFEFLSQEAGGIRKLALQSATTTMLSFDDIADEAVWGMPIRPGSIVETLGTNANPWRFFLEAVLTASLPAAGAAQDGRVLIEDGGAGNKNLIIYSGGQRFRIDGGAAF